MITACTGQAHLATTKGENYVIVNGCGGESLAATVLCA